jgi:hypothetical protein
MKYLIIPALLLALVFLHSRIGSFTELPVQPEAASRAA